MTKTSYIYISSTNEESLLRLGKILSANSRRARAKRINVNLKINGIAYLVEVIGGFLIVVLFFVSHEFWLSTWKVFFPLGIWYGLVVPSCYLVNNDCTKDLIMKHGWTSALRTLCTKNIVSSKRPSRNTAGRETKRDNPADEKIPKTSHLGVAKECTQHRTLDLGNQDGSLKSITEINSATSSDIKIFYLSGKQRSQIQPKKYKERFLVLRSSPVNYLQTDSTSKNSDDVCVVDM